MPNDKSERDQGGASRGRAAAAFFAGARAVRVALSKGASATRRALSTGGRLVRNVASPALRRAARVDAARTAAKARATSILAEGKPAVAALPPTTPRDVRVDEPEDEVEAEAIAEPEPEPKPEPEPEPEPEPRRSLPVVPREVAVPQTVVTKEPETTGRSWGNAAARALGWARRSLRRGRGAAVRAGRTTQVGLVHAGRTTRVGLVRAGRTTRVGLVRAGRTTRVGLVRAARATAHAGGVGVGLVSVASRRAGAGLRAAAVALRRSGRIRGRVVGPAVETEVRPEARPEAAPIQVPAPGIRRSRLLWKRVCDGSRRAWTSAVQAARGLRRFVLAHLPRRLPERPSRRRLVVSGAGLAVAFIGYVLAQAAIAGTVASGTVALGVEIGGMGRGEAQAALEGFASDAASSAVRFVADGEVTSVSSEALGLSIDAQATLDGLTGFSWSPASLWRHAFGGGVIEPIITVDRNALKVSAAEIAHVLSRDVSDADVTLGSGGVDVQPGQDGVFVYAPQVESTILREWPSSEPINLSAVVTAPAWTTADAERFAAVVDQTVFGSPATLTSPNGSVTITPEDVVAYGSIVKTGTGYALRMDGAALADAIRARLPGVESGAVDASFSFDAQHQLAINPGAPARALDVSALGDAVVTVLSGVSRTAPLPIVEMPAAVTPNDLASSDFKELVSSYATSFIPREPKREHNIANAASRLAGTIIYPGETVSVSDAIGPIDAAHGYISAGMIVEGVHTNGMGGGLCQIATTVYNAVYLAGLDIVERHAHSEWFPRYPAGRDAAISSDGEMRFTNDTPYEILINAYVEDAQLHVDFWSTHYYDTESSSSGMFNVHHGGRVAVTDRPCTNTAGKDGFSITDTRTVYLDGVLVKQETRTSSYKSVPGTLCS